MCVEGGVREIMTVAYYDYDDDSDYHHYVNSLFFILLLLLLLKLNPIHNHN